MTYTTVVGCNDDLLIIFLSNSSCNWESFLRINPSLSEGDTVNWKTSLINPLVSLSNTLISRSHMCALPKRQFAGVTLHLSSGHFTYSRYSWVHFLLACIDFTTEEAVYTFFSLLPVAGTTG